MTGTFMDGMLNRMKISFLLLSCMFFMSCPISAAVIDSSNNETAIYPELPQRAASSIGFVPEGWKLEKELRDDLNGDGIMDLVVLLRKLQEPDLLKKTATAEFDSFDTKPRILAAALGSPAESGFTLVMQNHTLIPLHDSPVMSDPFSKLTLKRGVMKITLESWASMGSWYSSNITFTFRYRDNCFKLIGYDRYELHRGSGREVETSINFQTGRKNVSSGLADKKHRIKSSRFQRSPLSCIEKVGEGFAFEAP
ncbi:MAG: hypothetical protein HGA46_05360 [Chlorobiaceae bacterium]|jgi:hypothetical protein|nr:hypothetical protein [Chlorobiaceae bacterium]